MCDGQADRRTRREKISLNIFVVGGNHGGSCVTQTIVLCISGQYRITHFPNSIKASQYRIDNKIQTMGRITLSIHEA